MSRAVHFRHVRTGIVVTTGDGPLARRYDPGSWYPPLARHQRRHRPAWATDASRSTLGVARISRSNRLDDVVRLTGSSLPRSRIVGDTEMAEKDAAETAWMEER